MFTSLKLVPYGAAKVTSLEFSTDLKIDLIWARMNPKKKPIKIQYFEVIVYKMMII